MASTVEDQLVVRMEASLRKFERQMEAGRKSAVAAATGSENAWKKSGDQITANANRAATGLQRLTNVSGRGRFVLQNTANQIGDVAVQMGAGTSAMRALGLQMPQLLGGFGALGGTLGILGPVMGTVAALGFPLAAAFLASGDEAESLDDAVKGLKETMEGLSVPMKILEMDADQLRDAYGSAAETVLNFARVQAELRASQAEARLRDQAGILNDVASGYTDAVKAGRNYKNTINRIMSELELTNSQAREFESLMSALQAAQGFEAQSAALEDLNGYLVDNNVEMAKLPTEIQAAIDDMITFVRETARAVQATNQLAAAAANVTIGVPLYDQSHPGGLLPPDRPVKPVVARRGGGGGGGRARVPEGLREAERLFESTRTKAEEYAAEVERINELHRMFPEIVTTEVKDRAMAALDDAMKAAGNMTDRLQSGFEDAFAAFVTGTGDARDAASALAADLAKMFARSAFQSLGGDGGGVFSGIGKVLGSLLSFDGGGYTGSGSRSGGVDGKGGFPAILHPNETVVDHTKSRSGVGGHITVGLASDGVNIVPVIRSVSGNMIAQSAPAIVAASDRRLPQNIDAYSARRG